MAGSLGRGLPRPVQLPYRSRMCPPRPRGGPLLSSTQQEGRYALDNEVAMGTTRRRATRPPPAPPPAALDDLLAIALDMTTALSSEDRSRRLVAAVRRALPCDAAVLLRLEGEDLIPLAAHGLSEDVLGRRFPRREHPRLDIVCRAAGPTLFPAESDLPDPYDGWLVDGPELHVHSCLGCPLRIEGELVGVLTADAQRVGAFDGVDRRVLEVLSALAAAALRTGDMIEA